MEEDRGLKCIEVVYKVVEKNENNMREKKKRSLTEKKGRFELRCLEKEKGRRKNERKKIGK